jgi:hypothetical protein
MHFLNKFLFLILLAYYAPVSAEEKDQMPMTVLGSCSTSVQDQVENVNKENHPLGIVN